MKYAQYLQKIISNATDPNKETALFWWAAEYVALQNYTETGGFEFMSFFNTSGIALPILRNFGQFRHLSHLE